MTTTLKPKKQCLPQTRDAKYTQKMGTDEVIGTVLSRGRSRIYPIVKHPKNDTTSAFTSYIPLELPLCTIRAA